MIFCVYLPRSMKLACGWRLPGRCREVALLPGPSILWPMDRVPAARGKCAHSPKRVSEKIGNSLGWSCLFEPISEKSGIAPIPATARANSGIAGSRCFPWRRAANNSLDAAKAFCRHLAGSAFVFQVNLLNCSPVSRIELVARYSAFPVSSRSVESVGSTTSPKILAFAFA